MKTEAEQIAVILQDVLDVLERDGALQMFACAPDDCGLPLVGERLRRALTIAESISPAGLAETSGHRLQ